MAEQYDLLQSPYLRSPHTFFQRVETVGPVLGEPFDVTCRNATQQEVLLHYGRTCVPTMVQVSHQESGFGAMAAVQIGIPDEPEVTALVYEFELESRINMFLLDEFPPLHDWNYTRLFNQMCTVLAGVEVYLANQE